jgi:uncharacterized protein (DUF427 family)
MYLSREKMEYKRIFISPRVERSPRWVRVKYDGTYIADSKKVVLLRQYGPGKLPTYYFPKEDVHLEMLVSNGNKPSADGFIGWTVQTKNKTAENAAWTYADPPETLDMLRNHVSFEWDEMDGWFEEEEEIFVHARDPYKRVDVLRSSRNVRVRIGEETIAHTRNPVLLFETHLPTRYYIPKEDVQMNLLEQTQKITRCPYKGLATYYSVKLGNRTYDNVAWSIPDPIRENPKIKNLICFFNEKVDLIVDNEYLERPITPWS